MHSGRAAVLMQTQEAQKREWRTQLGSLGGTKGWVVSSLVLKIWELVKCKKEEHSRKKEMSDSEGMNWSGFVGEWGLVRGSRAWCLVFEAHRPGAGGEDGGALPRWITIKRRGRLHFIPRHRLAPAGRTETEPRLAFRSLATSGVGWGTRWGRGHMRPEGAPGWGRGSSGAGDGVTEEESGGPRGRHAWV